MSGLVMQTGQWHPGETHNLDTLFYAEYQSTGPGANPAPPAIHTRPTNCDQAKRYETAHFLAGPDHWNP